MSCLRCFLPCQPIRSTSCSVAMRLSPARITMCIPNRSSSALMASRLWFRMYSATSRFMLIRSSSILPLAASSSTTRSICSAAVSTERTRPVPSQCGQTDVIDSLKLRRSLCRDISRRPKWLIDPIWMRARSLRMASFMRRSTACWFRFSSMSMKSTTISPERSRSRSWRASSSAASRFVFSAVSSMLRSRVERPEFTSMATSASVWLITR